MICSTPTGRVTTRVEVGYPTLSVPFILSSKYRYQTLTDSVRRQRVGVGGTWAVGKQLALSANFEILPSDFKIFTKSSFNFLRGSVITSSSCDSFKFWSNLSPPSMNPTQFQTAFYVSPKHFKLSAADLPSAGRTGPAGVRVPGPAVRPGGPGRNSKVPRGRLSRRDLSFNIGDFVMLSTRHGTRFKLNHGQDENSSQFHWIQEKVSDNSVRLEFTPRFQHMKNDADIVQQLSDSALRSRADEQ